MSEGDELRAARQEYVLSVIHLMPVNFERSRATAKQPAAFEEVHSGARILQFERSRQARKPGSDDRYPLLLSHDLTTTRNFSVFDKAARSRNGRAGSRSIFLSSSS